MDEEKLNTDAAIDEVLDGRPRAAQLEEMIDALGIRLATFQRERDSATDAGRRNEWEGRIREVERQVQVLREEQAITEFVENTVRAALSRPPRPLEEDEADY